MVALFTISLAIALPKMSKSIQRDRELETMQRGKQYIRAIKMYYKKFGAYPPNVDALVKPTNNIRFLRKKYIDPTTGKDEWKPILFGQNKVPTAMGFFGQPMTGSTMAGTGPGASGTSGLSATGSQSGGLSQQATTDASSTGSTATSGSAFGSTTGSTSGTSGQTFGGAGIIGFSPMSPKQSILVYKKKNHYNEWEFVYDPLSEQMTMGGGNSGNGAGLGTGSGNGTFGSSNSFGNSSGAGSSSSGSNSGSSSPTPTPTTPQ
jgi:type II secretory pathway pseudopilin PulG